MEYLCSVLQRGRVVEYDEAELEILETGVTMDPKYVEK